MDRENKMRAIGLVLLSIAIIALLLTDADAKRRRSSAQGSQAAGALVRDLWKERWRKGIEGKIRFGRATRAGAVVEYEAVAV